MKIALTVLLFTIRPITSQCSDLTKATQVVKTAIAGLASKPLNELFETNWKLTGQAKAESVHAVKMSAAMTTTDNHILKALQSLSKTFFLNVGDKNTGKHFPLFLECFYDTTTTYVFVEKTGATLQSKLAEFKSFTFEQELDLAISLLTPVYILHTMNILLCDIKASDFVVGASATQYRLAGFTAAVFITQRVCSVDREVDSAASKMRKSIKTLWMPHIKRSVDVFRLAVVIANLHPSDGAIDTLVANRAAFERSVDNLIRKRKDRYLQAAPYQRSAISQYIFLLIDMLNWDAAERITVEEALKKLYTIKKYLVFLNKNKMDQGDELERQKFREYLTQIYNESKPDKTQIDNMIKNIVDF